MAAITGAPSLAPGLSPTLAAMTISASSVAAASRAWVWIPDVATVTETDEYTIVRAPDYFPHPLTVAAFRPDGAGPGGLAGAVAAVLDRAREFGLPELQWHVLLGSPPGLAEELASHGGTVQVSLDVLARELRSGAPDLPPPAADVTVRWATDVATARDSQAVAVATFGGSAPPDERVAQIAADNAASVPAGTAGMVVAYLGGAPVGAGGLAIVDGVARLWGGAVVEPARGQGVYRALLAARLAYAVSHGASMALVRARTDTSGPILLRAGFAGYGNEPIYHIPL
jgi:GNAT superfamily N-acetyltransferase